MRIKRDHLTLVILQWKLSSNDHIVSSEKYHHDSIFVASGKKIYSNLVGIVLFKYLYGTLVFLMR